MIDRVTRIRDVGVGDMLCLEGQWRLVVFTTPYSVSIRDPQLGRDSELSDSSGHLYEPGIPRIPAPFLQLLKEHPYR